MCSLQPWGKEDILKTYLASVHPASHLRWVQAFSSSFCGRNTVIGKARRSSCWHIYLIQPVLSDRVSGFRTRICQPHSLKSLSGAFVGNVFIFSVLVFLLACFFTWRFIQFRGRNNNKIKRVNFETFLCNEHCISQSA